MIVSIHQRKKCVDLMYSLKSFNEARATRDRRLRMLANEDGLRAGLSTETLRVLIAKSEELMDIYEEKFVFTLRLCCRIHSRLYIDADGIIWTGPPQEII